MAYDAGLVACAAEAMEPGHVTHRPMMGGATLYCDGTVFAIVVADALWFKADAASDAAWDAAGAKRFSYLRRDGTVATMNYRRAPDEVLDDAEAFRRWAGLALEAGLRGPGRRKRVGDAPARRQSRQSRA